jgi:protein TonB
MQFNFTDKFLIKTALILCLAFSQSIYCKAQTAQPDSAGVYTTVDEPAAFKGGLQGLSQYLSNNLQYPKEASAKNIGGKVVLTFIVEKNGKVSHVEAISSPDISLSNEAIKVMTNCPHWRPARVNEKPVKMRYTVPISFSLPVK